MENNESANDLDMIDEKQLKKYLLIHLGEKELSESELERWKIKYYLDMEIHHIESDPLNREELELLEKKKK